ncbi:MAG TPA: signal peptidase II [Cellvibrionaceae bacterium]
MAIKYLKSPWCWYALAAIVVLLDQWSKMAIVAHLEYNTPVVFTSFFNFTLLYNTGAAFSFLSDAGGWQRWFFTAIAVVLSVVFIVWLARIGREKWLEALAISLILGGAVGNVYDRIMHGHVVDFIVVHYRDNYFPAFNIADSAISVGAVLLILGAFVEGKGKQEKAKQDKAMKDA